MWPELIGTARAIQMETNLLGTFWGLEKGTADGGTAKAGPTLDGSAAVLPSCYFYEANDYASYANIYASKQNKNGDT